MTDLLLTGFLPENDTVGNASRDLIAHLASQLPTGWAVELLPQESAALPGLLAELLGRHQPRLTILSGQAPGRNRLSLEAVALNVLDFRVADAAGDQPQDVPAMAAGPLARRSRLPLSDAAQVLREAGYPTSVSWHAGTFLCNQALFLTLDWITEHGRADQDALFLHIPLAPSQVILEKPMSEKPCLDTRFVGEATLRLGEWLLKP